MAAERQTPGGAFINEVATAQRQTPGGAFINETVQTQPVSQSYVTRTIEVRTGPAG